MTFHDIVNEISHLAPVRILSSASRADISKVKLWANHPESEKDTILFFGYDTQPESWPDHYILAFDRIDSGLFSQSDPFQDERPDSFSSDRSDQSDSVSSDHPVFDSSDQSDQSGSFSSDHPDSDSINPLCSDLTGSSIDLAIIPSEYFAAVFNHIQEFMSERNGNDYLHYLMETADKVKSVDTLIDMASKTFNASLVLIDRDFRILSHSNEIPVTDDLWVDNIKKGYCDYDFITEVRKLKSVQMADPGTTPFEVTCSASPYRKLACKVYCRDAWIGSLLLIEGDQTYRAEHAEMLRILSSVTGYTLLNYSPDLLYRTSDYQGFLYNLLIGTPLENLPEAYRNLKFHENMKLLYFRPENAETAPIRGRLLREAFHKELPDCHVITYRKATIVVCSTTDAEKVGKLLDLFPASCSVNVGISNPFHKIELLREALSEAEDALATGKSIDPERRIFPFEEFSISIMLRHFSETEDLTRYIHPAVLLLLKYDDQYKSKLLPTIREYITNNCSIKKTAEALFLHRNSVIYRLHKAEEISGLILNDPDTQFILRMSFLIMRTAPRSSYSRTPRRS